MPLPGDIGLVNIRGRAGLGIRLGQFLNGDGFEDIEHAFTVMPNNMVFEAEPGGARITSISEYIGRNVIYSRFPLTEKQRSIIVSTAEELVGTPYSALDYFSLALHRFHIRPKFITNYIASTKHMICSQIEDYLYLTAGYHLFDDNRFPGDVTPGALYQLITRYNLAHPS